MRQSDRRVLYTVGLGNVGVLDAVGLVAPHGVTVLVDVRRIGGSRDHSGGGMRHTRSELRNACVGAGIGFAWVEALCPPLELFQEFREKPRNRGSWVEYEARFLHYLTNSSGISELLEITSRGHVVALCCAERVPDTCHRRLVAEVFAVVHGFSVHHLVEGEETFPYVPVRKTVQARLL